MIKRLALFSGLAALAIAATAQPLAAAFSGLWSAKLRYGPDVRGPLVIQRLASGWDAEIAGLSTSANVHGRTIAWRSMSTCGCSLRFCSNHESISSEERD